MPIRALIVDDEPLARRGLQLRLAPIDDIVVCGEAGNGREAIESVRSLRPDVVFLDIQMPGMDGFAVLKTLQREPELPAVVFVTAYDKYAIEAFEAHALDYLLKPIDAARLTEAVDRVRVQRSQELALTQRDTLLQLICEVTGERVSLDELLASGQNALSSEYLRTLTIKDGRKIVRVDAEDIEWIDAARDYLCIHAGGQTFILRGTMKRLEARLDPLRFQRVHRSTIVNVKQVRELRAHMNGEYFLTLDSGAQVKLSRNYRDKLPHFVESL